jgi:hypothetical protein
MQGVTDIITLNVSGTLFQTTRSTLIKSPFLEALIRDCAPNKLEPIPVPFIDRDAKSFRHVLSLLRDPTYPFPPNLNHELHFYGLTFANPRALNPRAFPDKFVLFDDILQLPPDARGVKIAAGMVQLVPISDALYMHAYHSNGRRENWRATLTCVISHHLEANLLACGCPKETVSPVNKRPLTKLECDANTKLYVQAREHEVVLVKRCSSQELADMMCAQEKTGVYLRFVPVVKSLGTQQCAALLVVLNYDGHKFQ